MMSEKKKRKRCVTLTLHPQVLLRLHELLATGLYGSTLTETAETLMLRGLRAELFPERTRITR